METSFKDFFLNRIFSRKLIVWISSCFMLCFGFIDQNTWLIVSLGYIGVNSALTAIEAMKKTKEELSSKKSALEISEEKEGEA